MAAGIPLEGAADHGVSEALYLRDPDDNGVELYWDRPKEQWPLTKDGKLAMFTRRVGSQRIAGRRVCGKNQWSCRRQKIFRF